MPQPKCMQRYQRGRSQTFKMRASNELRADLDATKAMFEETVAQHVSYPVVIWRAVRLLKEHLATAPTIAERDVLMDLIARGKASCYPRPSD